MASHETMAADARFQDLIHAFSEEQRLLLLRADEEHESWRAALESAWGRLDSYAGSLPAASGHALRLLPSSVPALAPPLEIGLNVGKGLRTVQPDVSETVDPVPPPPPPPPSIPEDGNAADDTWDISVVDEDPVEQTMSANASSTASRPRRKSQVTHDVQNLLQDAMQPLPFRANFVRLVKRYIDYVAGVMVLLNSLVLIAELEVEGRSIAFEIDLPSGEDLRAYLPALRGIDAVFVLLFLVELVFRLLFERLKFCLDLANIFDGVLVLLGLIDMIISRPFTGGAVRDEDIALLKLTRALKSLRAVRILRSFRFVRGLRVLVKACRCFLPSLFWSMALLAVFVAMGALTLGNTLQVYILDDTLEHEDRQWLWDHYGTSQRSSWTLYEVTFAGNWPTNARPVMEKADNIFALFFLVYITIIVFALIRVISAIFLKDTLDVVQNDAEHMVVTRLKKRNEDIAKLEGVFRAIDKSGTGLINEEQLAEILSQSAVKDYLQSMDLDVHEGRALFHILDNGDGEVTLDEFIDGIMRCKGPARAIDQVAMSADMKNLDKKVNIIIQQLGGRDVSASKSVAPTPSPRTEVLRRQKSQAAYLKPFRLDMDNEQGFLARRASFGI